MSSSNEDQNTFLSPITKELFCKYRSLKEAYRRLEDEDREARLKLQAVGEANNSLRRQLEESRRLGERLNFPGQLAESQGLRVRLKAREEAISKLREELEAREMAVFELTSKVAWFTSALTAKEEILCKEINELKFQNTEKSAHIEFLEEKLHKTEMLLYELERVKQIYRLVNASLTENMLTYKNQFKAIASCSEKILAEKETRESEIIERDSKIKQLSKYTTTPKILVHLSQILHILKISERSTTDDSNSIFSYVPSIKNIVETMKKQLWNDQSVSLFTELEDSKTQTESLLKEVCTQCENFLEDKLVEANIPGASFFECERLKREIEAFVDRLKGLEEEKAKREDLRRELEMKLMGTEEDKKNREKELIQKEEELSLARERASGLEEDLAKYEDLLKRALETIQEEQNSQEIILEMVGESLERVLQDYNKNTETLNNFISESEDKIKILENEWNEIITIQDKKHSDYVSKIENEMQNLQNKYEEKKYIVQEQNRQIDYLKSLLAEKATHFKIIQEKLLNAEKIFEQINHSDCINMLSNQSSNILEKNEMVQSFINHNHLKKLNCPLTKKFVSRYQQTKRKNINLKMSVKKLKRTINKLKTKINKSGKEAKPNQKNPTIINVSSESTPMCERLKDERNVLLEQLKARSLEIDNMRILLNEKDSNYIHLAYEKEKMEKVLLRIIRDLELSMSLQTKSQESIGTVTESQAHEDAKVKDLTSRNKELSLMISELQDRLDSLLNIPEKENSAGVAKNSVSVQVNIDQCEKIKEIESNYSKQLQKIEKDLNTEKNKVLTLDKLRKDYESRLFKQNSDHKKVIHQINEENEKKIAELKVTYFRRTKGMKDKMEKLLFEKKDIERQKEMLDKAMKECDSKCKEVKKYYEMLLQNKFNEISEIRESYEKIISNKDEEMNKEITELKLEIENVIAKKEEILNKTKAASLTHVSNLKKRFKKAIDKLKNEKSLLNREIEEMREVMADMRSSKVENSSQADLTTQDMRERRDMVNSDSQTAFFYTHVKMTEEGVQAAAHSREFAAQADMDNQFRNMDIIPVNEELYESQQSGVPSIKKDLKINYRESIKCSIQETKGKIIGGFFKGFRSCSDVSRGDQNEVVRHLNMLEAELLDNMENYYRHAEGYEECLRRTRRQVAELERMLEEETADTYRLRERLSGEFRRAEELRAERDRLANLVSGLTTQLTSLSEQCQEEQEKQTYWKTQFENLLNGRKTSDELELSLKSLELKLDAAVNFEKAMLDNMKMEKMCRENKMNAFKYNLFSSNRDDSLALCKKYEEGNKNSETITSEQPKDRGNSRRDVKVLVYKRCEVRQTWSHQIQDNKTF